MPWGILGRGTAGVGAVAPGEGEMPGWTSPGPLAWSTMPCLLPEVAVGGQAAVRPQWAHPALPRARTLRERFLVAPFLGVLSSSSQPS